MNRHVLEFRLRLFQWGTLFTLGVLAFYPNEICFAQPTQVPGSNIQISNSRKIEDGSPDVKDVNSTSSAVDSRVEAIRKRIDVLKEVIAKKSEKVTEAEAGKPEIVSEPSKAAENSEQPKQIPNSSIPTMPAMEVPKKKGNEPAPGVKSKPSQATEPKLNPKPNPNPNPLEGLEINTSQINSLELANSLFQTGNFAQAMKSYEAMLILDNSELDTAWLRCLTANCYRVQKQFTKAERLYRDVAGFKETTFPNDHAQWYLEHISRRSKIEAELALLENELAPYKKENEEKK